MVAQHRQRLGVARAELEQALGKSLCQETLARFVKNGGVCKRVPKRPRREPHPLAYAHKVQCLSALEQMSQQGLLDLFYLNQSRVTMQACVPYACPYAWQFKEEEVFMLRGAGGTGGLNCWALLCRDLRCHFETTCGSINGAFVQERLDALSLGLDKLTVVVLDNAPAHRAAACKSGVRCGNSVAWCSSTCWPTRPSSTSCTRSGATSSTSGCVPTTTCM